MTRFLAVLAAVLMLGGSAQARPVPRPTIQSGHGARPLVRPYQHAVTVGSGCTVSDPVVAYSAATRAALGLTDWPDTQLGFYNGTTVATGAKAGGGQQQVTIASDGSRVIARTSIDHAPAGYQYVGAGSITPLAGWQFRMIHLETPYTAGVPVPFYTTVGVGFLNPANNVTTYLGLALSPQETRAQAKASGATVNIDTPANATVAFGVLAIVSTTSPTDVVLNYSTASGARADCDVQPDLTVPEWTPCTDCGLLVTGGTDGCPWEAAGEECFTRGNAESAPLSPEAPGDGGPR